MHDKFTERVRKVPSLASRWTSCRPVTSEPVIVIDGIGSSPNMPVARLS